MSKCTINISRKAQFSACAAKNVIKIDGIPCGKIMAGQSITIDVESGAHTVSVSDWTGREAITHVSLSSLAPYAQLRTKYRLSGEIVINGGNTGPVPVSPTVMVAPPVPLESQPTVPKAEHEVSIDIGRILSEEQAWRREQTGLPPIDYELSRVDTMDGPAFEAWCAELLEQNGFVDVQVTPTSADQGVDITAVKDGIRYAIQCKRYSSDLGNSPVQEVSAGKALYHCHIGAVMTNQHFTSGARELAEVTGTLLWDRDRLIQMMQCE